MTIIRPEKVRSVGGRETGIRTVKRAILKYVRKQFQAYTSPVTIVAECLTLGNEEVTKFHIFMPVIVIELPVRSLKTKVLPH